MLAMEPPIPDLRIEHISPSPSPSPSTSPSPSRASSPRSSLSKSANTSSTTLAPSTTSTAWGANFWVTITDPQTQAQFYACPATGECSWEPPENNFVLPPSNEGEWWELKDDARGGIPYFYHTRTQETKWDRPDGFVIPLGMIQNSAIGKRLSFVAEEPEQIPVTAADEPGVPSPSPAPAPPAIQTQTQPTSILKSTPTPTSPGTSSPRPRRTTTRHSPAPSSASAPTPSASASASLSPGYPTITTYAAQPSYPSSPARPRLDSRSKSASTLPASLSQSQSAGRPSLPNIELNLTAAAATIVSSSHAHAGFKSAPSSPRVASSGSGSGSISVSASHSAASRSPPSSPRPSSPKPNQPSPTKIRKQPSHTYLSAGSSTPSSPSIPTSPPSPLFPAAGSGSAFGSPSRPGSQLSLGSLASTTARKVPPSPLRPLPGAPNGNGHGNGNGGGVGNGRPGTAGAAFAVGPGGGKAPLSLSLSVGPAAPAGLGIQLPGAGQGQGQGQRQRSATFSSARSISAPMVNGHGPVLNGFGYGELNPPLSPISPFSLRPIPTAPIPLPLQTSSPSKRLSTGEQHPALPPTLQDDIKRFATSEYARKFFSQRRRGFWFLKRRKVPVDEMMRWQKGPLDGPLLVMNGSLHRDAINAFKVIQRIMGDRDPLKPIGVRIPSANPALSASSPSSSFSSGSTTWVNGAGDGSSIIEEERWLLQAGVSHIELRDEIYCQLMKQLAENPSTESAFRGWQLFCVLIVTFPPSKYFEDHLTSFLNASAAQTEGKVDVMAKYCLRRKEIIMWKGPRGKAPSLEEIEAASDAAFHPSVFGESLPLILALQAATYPPSEHPVPIILPFLSSGILALGGMKEEGIFRLPGDSDAVASLRLRIEQGHYHLEGVEDPHVCASLLKSWLRELREPVVPEGEMYNLALQAAATHDPERIIDIVRRLPEPNRRVLLYVISFLQSFGSEDVVEHTKMTEEGLARVMTPNIIRGRTGDLDIAFGNNHFENIFVGMLLRHLDCSTLDPGYRPVHGRAG